MSEGVRALVAAALLALAGCVNSRAPDRWASVPDRERAVIFGAITADTSSGYTLSRHEVSYRNISMGEMGSFSFAPVRAIIAEFGSNRGDPELKLPDRSLGRFFEVTLPASEHECFHMRLVNRHAHLGSTSWTAKEPFFVPFKVAAGGGTH